MDLGDLGSPDYNQGNRIDSVEMKDGSVKPLGVVDGHAFQGQLLDLKKLKEAAKVVYEKYEQVFTKGLVNNILKS